MNNFISQLFWILVFLIIISTTSVMTFSQIGPLGIYGCPPESYRANVRYAQLEGVPGGGDDRLASIDYTIPVNGLKNFNFYYDEDGGFLPGGLLKITYWGETQALGAEFVNYSPNSGHTNGYQIRPFNNPPSTPLGIHANVYGYNAVGAVVALQNMDIYANLGADSQHVKTNGNGYFSVYYSNGNPAGFLGSGDHREVWIIGYQNGCAYQGFVPGYSIIWSPDTNPNSPWYYVANAEQDISEYIGILSCTVSGG